MVQTYSSDGTFMTMTVAATKTATAGSWAEMTDDFTVRDNETVSGTQVIGTFLTGGAAGTEVTVQMAGIVTVTAGSAGCTAGKLVVIDNAAATKVEDGTTAGTVVGIALDTIAADATGKVKIWKG